MMHSLKSAWHRLLIAVLCPLVASVGMSSFAEEMPPAPQPLTGRMPLALQGTAVELSQPLPISTTKWLDPDDVTLLRAAPRVASLVPVTPAPTPPPKSPPDNRPAHRSALKQAPDSSDKQPSPRSTDANDIAGAFALPGQVTAASESEVKITLVEEDEVLDATMEKADLPPANDDTEAEFDEGAGDAETEETADSANETELREPSRIVPSAKPLIPLTRNQIYLRTKLRKVLAYYYTRPLNSQEHDCWEVMHGMLAYELHSKVRDGGPRAKPITAIGHLCYNRTCKRKQMLRLNNDGEIDARVGVGIQGHKGQFLAMLAQCNVTPDYPMLIDGKQLTIHDLIESEQKSCEAKTELTFKLIGLMHYLPSDATWVDNRGESWDIPRLIREELAQPIRGAACGGTHRLSGLTLAARKRVARGEPLDGDWLKAAQFVKKYQNYAYRLQNRDGSLSTSWFQGPGSENDIDRRIKTTGHILEWLLYAASDEQLRSPRTVRAINYLTNLLYSNSRHEWEVGPLSHALHALVIYDKRVFQPYDDLPEELTAKAVPRDSRPTARRSRTSRSR